jgi:chromosome partitioning protein
MPKGVSLHSDVGRSEVVTTIKNADGDGKIVVVDLEGVASQLVSRAISQADLVIVPMQPTALDAEIGSEALALVREEEEALSRSIRHAVVLTKTSAAVKSRVQRELEDQLRGAGIDMIEPSLVARAAFSELFAYGGDLTSMMNNPEIVTGGKVDKALLNAQAFTEAVYERLK